MIFFSPNNYLTRDLREGTDKHDYFRVGAGVFPFNRISPSPKPGYTPHGDLSVVGVDDRATHINDLQEIPSSYMSDAFCLKHMYLEKDPSVLSPYIPANGIILIVSKGTPL